MVKANQISFSYGGDAILDSASFTVGTNQKVGLVGVNGSGKSTLLKIIIGQEVLTDGKLEVLGGVGYVPQEIKRDKNLEEAGSIRAYIDPKAKMPDFDLNRLLAGLEYKVSDLDKKPQKLSGGQKTKLALARVLIDAPDILILDEPTNFMDKAGKRFVMDFLSRYPKTLLIVSHDLDLLDKHIDKVFEVNKHTKKIDEYKGDYSDYLRLKKEREELAKRAHRVALTHVKKLEKAVNKGKFKSKKGARRKVVLTRRLEKEKEALPELPPEIRGFKLNLPEPPRVGELPMKIVNISKSYGDQLIINDLSFVVRRGEKFLLIGPNGSGKSTLIKIMMKIEKPDKGYIDEGMNLKVGYYSQEFESFDMESRVLDWVSLQGKVHEGAARALLSRFMFDETKVKQKIFTLSGGEKTRLSIALLMLTNNNMLILDEPTTYLDPMSQRIVLEALKEYKGALFLVSHVEDFVKEIKPDRALIMPDARLVLWDEKYLDSVGEV